MIRISQTQIITLDFEKFKIFSNNEGEERKFAYENSSIQVNPTRLGKILIKIEILDTNRPESFTIYYFQQFSKSQRQPYILPLDKNNLIEINITESDFWLNNPLIVDTIGVLGSGTGICKLKVEVFKIL